MKLENEAGKGNLLLSVLSDRERTLLETVA